MGDEIIRISYAMQNYEREAYPSFLSAFGGPMRRSDTLIAWWISRAPDAFKVVESSRYLGRDHIVAEFDLPGSSTARLHIDAATGFITRMDRDLGEDENLTYLWTNHERKDEIAYATLFQIHYNDHLEAVVTNRRIEPNHAMKDAYEIDAAIKEEPPRIEANVTSHKALSETVFLTGMEGSYSLFVDAGDYIIAAGTTEGFKERFEYFGKSRGIDKPLRYVVVTQHAGPHIAGLPDATALGATIIAPRTQLSAIEVAASHPNSDVRLKALDSQISIGPLEIHNITTTHADYIPLIYISEIKGIYQADSYGNTYINAPGFAGIGAVTLRDEIKRIGLDVERILFIYNPEVGRFDNFEKAVEAFILKPCFSSRDICQK